MELYEVLIIVISNLIIGTLIGISGIAGFMLPLIYVSILGIPLRDALALSFIAFMLGGMFGTYSYWKFGNIDFKFGSLLSIGSFLGAIIGVKLNTMIPVDTAKILLYIVVLLSGLSILLRKNGAEGELLRESPLLKSKPFVIITGLVTGGICALTGAGGPILVVPVLANLGVNMKVAVGVSLLNSIIIALPSTVGYLSQSNLDGMLIFALVSSVSHIAGILMGAKISDKINLLYLKRFVSFISIGSSLYMMATTFVKI